MKFLNIIPFLGALAALQKQIEEAMDDHQVTVAEAAIICRQSATGIVGFVPENYRPMAIKILTVLFAAVESGAAAVGIDDYVIYRDGDVREYSESAKRAMPSPKGDPAV